MLVVILYSFSDRSPGVGMMGGLLTMLSTVRAIGIALAATAPLIRGAHGGLGNAVCCLPSPPPRRPE